MDSSKKGIQDTELHSAQVVGDPDQPKTTSKLRGCGKIRSKASMQRVLPNRGRRRVSGLELGGSSNQDDAPYEDPA